MTRPHAPIVVALRWVCLFVLFLSVVGGIYGFSIRALTPDDVRILPWPTEWGAPGEWSGALISADGSRLQSVTDDGHYAVLTLERDTDGALIGARKESSGHMVWPWTGMGELDHIHSNAEALALAPDGRIAVAFEIAHRVWLYNELGGRGEAFEYDSRLTSLPPNTGIEALATVGEAFLAIPEAPANGADEFRTLWMQDGVWREGPLLTRDVGWRVTGADVGPDGGLYLLERRFWGVGFGNRLRRIALIEGADRLDGPVVYEAPPGRHGNLEGIAVWQDANGTLRATLVTDDNGLLPLQRREIVEIPLPPLAPAAPDA